MIESALRNVKIDGCGQRKAEAEPRLLRNLTIVSYRRRHFLLQVKLGSRLRLWTSRSDPLLHLRLMSLQSQ